MSRTIYVVKPPVADKLDVVRVHWGVKDPARPVKQMGREKVADAVARVYPRGYDADVPNGTGGTRRIRIIPMR